LCYLAAIEPTNMKIGPSNLEIIKYLSSEEGRMWGSIIRKARLLHHKYMSIRLQFVY